VWAFGWHAPLWESPVPGTSGEKRTVAFADPAAASVTVGPVPYTGVMCVGSGELFASRRTAFGGLAREQGVLDVFVSVSV